MSNNLQNVRQNAEILIVEDSPTQAEQLRFVLEQAGYVVRSAANGRIALESAMAQPPTLIITDILMPEMDGYELCAALKADPELKHVPVVMVTALSGVQDIAKSLECGADNFIRKPFDAQALLKRIEYILLNLELRKSSRVQLGMEICMGGTTHFVTSGREQIVDLLISTYEEAVRMNAELHAQQNEIAASNRALQLLHRVAAELNAAQHVEAAIESTLHGVRDLLGPVEISICMADCEGILTRSATLGADGVVVGREAGEACRCEFVASDGGAVLRPCASDAAGAVWSVPLEAGAQHLGAIEIASDPAQPIGSDAKRQLSALANQAAVAIGRAQLLSGLEAQVSQRTAALQAEVVERKRAEKKVGGLNRVLSVLNGINAAILRIRDRDDLFREACRVAVELGQFPIVWIGLQNAEGEGVSPVAWRAEGAGGELSLVNGNGTLGVPDCILAEVMREHRVRICKLGDDCCKDDYPAALAERGCRSMAVFPLIVETRAVGVIALYAHEAEFFEQPQELKLLGDLAGDLSFALEFIGKGEALAHLAHYDAITGLPNRALMRDRLDQLLRISAEKSAEIDNASWAVGLVVLAVARFKSINESFGRQAGDRVLRAVGERLAKALGGTDHLARIGSDRFAIVLDDIADAADLAHKLQARIDTALDEPFQIDDRLLRLAFRGGAALAPGDGMDADQLFSNAEAALDRAGHGAEGLTFYAPGMTARVADQLALEGRLHRAVEHNEFVLYYQPKVSLADGSVVGLEALIRWADPEVGLVPPNEFIPLLEETGLIVRVGQWVFEQAAADSAAWRAMGFNPPRIAVNVSPLQLRRRDFVDSVVAALGIKRGQMEEVPFDIEITEGMLMESIDDGRTKLGALRELGLRVYIDDFGTGYCSLNYLKRLPIDVLKIDQSFVRDLTNDSDAATICTAIIGLAHNLRLKVIAEGVETEAQMRLLRRHLCDEIQGYLFSRPLPFADCSALLKQQRKLVLPPAAVAGRRVVLLVDDEPNVLQSLVRLLRGDGYEILTASSAHEAFEMLAANEVGVVVSDQRMPEMNGTDFLAHVRDMYPDVVRMVLSGYTDLETVTRAINRGAIYKFLTKPWDDEEMRAHIREAFERHEKATGQWLAGGMTGEAATAA